jgi:hypothetical protein
MATITLKLSEQLNNQIRVLAEKEKTTTSAIVRKALEEYIARGPAEFEGSFMDLTRDILGVFEGPGDLSTNKRYLKDYGR